MPASCPRAACLSPPPVESTSRMHAATKCPPPHAPPPLPPHAIGATPGHGRCFGATRRTPRGRCVQYGAARCGLASRRCRLTYSPPASRSGHRSGPRSGWSGPQRPMASRRYWRVTRHTCLELRPGPSVGYISNCCVPDTVVSGMLYGYRHILNHTALWPRH